MALTNPFDTATPAGGDDPKAGDDRIRELKDAIVEREGQDHYWPASGTTYDNDDCGLHSKVTLLVGAAPSSKADAGIVYAKDVSAKAELHYKDEDGNEIQITSGGTLNESADVFVTGDLLLSSVSTAHSGWTNVTATYASRHIRVGDTVLGTGGSATHTHEAGSYTVPAHNHGGSTGGVTFGGGGSLTSGALDTAHYHSISTQAAATITGTSAAGANTPLYVDVRIFKKD